MANSNYFALFGLKPSFELDLAAVKTSFHQLIKQSHPDNFIAADETTKLAKLQQTKLLNEAYQTLVHPVKRAFYLLEMNGLNLNAEQTMQDPQFLQQGLEWHEQLAEFATQQNVNKIEYLSEQIADLQIKTQQEFATIYQDQKQQNKAMQLAQRMQFLNKLQIKVNELLEQIDLLS